MVNWLVGFHLGASLNISLVHWFTGLQAEAEPVRLLSNVFDVFPKEEYSWKTSGGNAANNTGIRDERSPCFDMHFEAFTIAVQLSYCFQLLPSLLQYYSVPTVFNLDSLILFPVIFCDMFP
jgi:hypothetical protein